VLGVAEAGCTRDDAPASADHKRADELDSAATRCLRPRRAIDLFQQHDELLTEEERCRGAFARSRVREEEKRLMPRGKPGRGSDHPGRAAVLACSDGSRFRPPPRAQPWRRPEVASGRLRAALADAPATVPRSRRRRAPGVVRRARLFAADMLEELDQNGDATVASTYSVARQAAGRDSREAVEFRARAGSARVLPQPRRHLEAASVFRNASVPLPLGGTGADGAGNHNLGTELSPWACRKAAGEFRPPWPSERARTPHSASALRLFGSRRQRLLSERDEAYDYWPRPISWGFLRGTPAGFSPISQTASSLHGNRYVGRGVALMGEIRTTPPACSGSGRQRDPEAPRPGPCYSPPGGPRAGVGGDVAESLELCRDMTDRYADVDERRRSCVYPQKYALPATRQGHRRPPGSSMCCGTLHDGRGKTGGSPARRAAWRVRREVDWASSRG